MIQGWTFLLRFTEECVWLLQLSKEWRSGFIQSCCIKNYYFMQPWKLHFVAADMCDVQKKTKHYILSDICSSGLCGSVFDGADRLNQSAQTDSD